MSDPVLQTVPAPEADGDEDAEQQAAPFVDPLPEVVHADSIAKW